MTSVSETDQGHGFDDALARRNALILSGAQALGGASASIVIAVAGLAGYELLGADKALATLPITAFVIGTACSTVPAAMLMRRIGRRPGFQSGALLGILGGLLAGYSILADSFWLFCLSMFLNGSNAAFVQQFRFAAADTASEKYRPKAISLVLAGGILAGIIGPQTVILTKDLFAPILFVGSFFAQAGLCFISLLLLSFVNVPGLSQSQRKTSGRPLKQIMRTHRFIVAVACGISIYALMSLVMTATPLAMIACGLTESDAALAIQWHVLAMFGPSFFTGALISRFGAVRIIAVGLFLMVGCGIVALAGLQVENFWFALILLGLGWNFGYIGATSMLTETYRPEERNKVQAANEFLVFGFVAAASFSSGNLLFFFGWNAVNLFLFPVVGACLLLLAWLVLYEKRLASA